MLEARELTCERGGRVLFRELSFSAEPGEALRIGGANGSGKTSLLRILCGLLAPTSGEVRWRGRPIGSLKEEFSMHLVYLGHAAALKDELSARENLGIACTLAGQRPSPQETLQALQAFGLGGEATPVRRLSQGQRRRAALARLQLAGASPLWLLDEPFSGLDSPGIKVVENTLTEQLARGGAIVFTTHQEAGLRASRMVELGNAH
jgi:heme exporter protein A